MAKDTTEARAQHTQNPVGIDGIACVEVTAPDEAGRAAIANLLSTLGFSRTHRHEAQHIDLYRQHDIVFLLNHEPTSFAAGFADAHGPSIPSMGWWVHDAAHALGEAVRRGAEPYSGPSPFGDAPAIRGIGGSLIHFLEKGGALEQAFVPLESPDLVPDRAFLTIDHLTNNVPKGTMADWQRFYMNVFGFTEVRRFDIEGRSTGLLSYALRSPCGTFCIPINEGKDDRSQIDEYLREYRGPGIQHIAFLSRDLLHSLEGLGDAGVPTLDMDDAYYATAFDRVPGLREDPAAIRAMQVLVDGDADGYLLQIFTKNVIGPIFFEMIQRENHLSFGEGNFGALFRSIERDQERRGVL